MTAVAIPWEVVFAMTGRGEESDEELMERFQRGERAAFDRLFDRYAAPLTQYLTRLTGNAASAEDAVQLTFLSVVRSRAQFVRGSKVRPWLYAIASNAARDRFRRTRREQPAAEAPPERAVDDAHGDPGLRQRLLDALQALPQAQREAVVLHRLEGWSFAEIAEAVGASETAVKVRAFRGTQVLRERLKDVWEFDA